MSRQGRRIDESLQTFSGKVKGYKGALQHERRTKKLLKDVKVMIHITLRSSEANNVLIFQKTSRDRRIELGQAQADEELALQEHDDAMGDEPYPDDPDIEYDEPEADLAQDSCIEPPPINQNAQPSSMSHQHQPDVATPFSLARRTDLRQQTSPGPSTSAIRQEVRMISPPVSPSTSSSQQVFQVNIVTHNYHGAGHPDAQGRPQAASYEVRQGTSHSSGARRNTVSPTRERPPGPANALVRTTSDTSGQWRPPPHAHTLDNATPPNRMIYGPPMSFQASMPQASVPNLVGRIDQFQLDDGSGHQSTAGRTQDRRNAIPPARANDSSYESRGRRLGDSGSWNNGDGGQISGESGTQFPGQRPSNIPEGPSGRVWQGLPSVPSRRVSPGNSQGGC